MTSLTKWTQKLLLRRHGQLLRAEDHASRLNGQLNAVDPLVAARDHNIKNSPLVGLPEEALLLILEHISDDIVALYCLRRVSRVFRRLIYEPRIWIRIQKDGRSDREAHWHLSESELRQMKLHLRADGMCRKCKLECDVPVSGLFRKLAQTVNLSIKSDLRYGLCRFNSYSSPNSLLHCSPCGTHHERLAFSSNYDDPSTKEKRCRGRDGAVQLCEHVSMYWADVENHFTKWRKRRPGEWQADDWKACLEDFTLECHDRSHDTRCGAEESPTWPRARLHTGESEEGRVVLTLEWRPHSGFDLFSRTAEGQVPAPQLRELFRQHRKGPAKILLPSYPSNPLPEMACYDLSNGRCRCLYYEEGGGAAFGAAGSREQTTFFRKDIPFEHRHKYRRHSFDMFNEEVSTTKHWSRGAGGSPCLITSYERHIPLFATAGNDRVNPSHAWFHAMDPDTCPRRMWVQELPLCEDEGCMNYYRRPKVFRCVCGPGTLHHPCICDTWEYRKEQLVKEALWSQGLK